MLKSRFLAGLFALGLIAIVILVFAIAPENSCWLPPCLFHQLTGLYCPGCGSTRALHRLLHGNLAGAWRASPLLFLFLPLLIYVLGGQAILGLTGRKMKPLSLPVWASWLILWGIILFWIARNIPVYPFTLLAPR